MKVLFRDQQENITKENIHSVKDTFYLTMRGPKIYSLAPVNLKSKEDRTSSPAACPQPPPVESSSPHSVWPAQDHWPAYRSVPAGLVLPWTPPLSSCFIVSVIPSL